MKITFLLIKLLLASVFLAPLVTANAASYPKKSITLIVPFAPGGGTDSIARDLAKILSEKLGQSVIVDNRGGGGGSIGASMGSKAEADGYTLLFVTSTFITHAATDSTAGYNIEKDFSPVALLTVSTNVIAVHPSVPVNTLKEFIAYAKANPGKLNYASQGNGSVSHIGTEIFKQTTGVEMVHVPYKGSGPAIQDVLAGQVQVFISTPPSLMQHVQSGKLKGLAVTGKNRHPGMPNVPTTAEAGLPSFQLESWVALYAPAGTPAPVITKLTNSVKKSLALPEVKERSDAAGVELRYLNPAQTDALVKKEIPLWSKAIKAANITLD